MFGNWLKRKRQLKAVQTHTEDIQRFIAMLKGVTDSEMAMIVLVATFVRLDSARRLNRLNVQELMEAPHEDRLVLCQMAIDLGETIRECQRDPLQHSIATAFMVWLHSVRSYVCPEIRYLGQEMWRELQRGMAHTEQTYALMVAGGFLHIPPDTLDHVHYVPALLKPFRAQST